MTKANRPAPACVYVSFFSAERSCIRAGDSSPGPPGVSVQKAWEAFRTTSYILTVFWSDTVSAAMHGSVASGGTVEP